MSRLILIADFFTGILRNNFFYIKMLFVIDNFQVRTNIRSPVVIEYFSRLIELLYVQIHVDCIFSWKFIF